MAKLETFLVFEKALATRINRIWSAKVEDAMPDLLAAANSGDLLVTDQILNGLNIADEVAEALPSIRLMMVSAMLFGAELISGDVKKSALMAAGEPLLVDSALTAFNGMVTTSLQDLVAREASKTLGVLLTETSDTALMVRKSDEAMDAAIRDMVLGNGKMMADIGANLTTSRLVNYGALFEMNAKGIKTYRLDATLDERTSAVCRRMHGKTFNVEVAMSYTENALRTTDPNELKQAAPWIKSNKATLYILEHTANDELQKMGFACPPFHPRCRTVVRETGDVTVTGLEYEPVVLDNPPVSALSILKPARKPKNPPKPEDNAPHIPELVPDVVPEEELADLTFLLPDDDLPPKK